MRTKFSGILTLLLAFVVQFTFAQEKTVSGTVTDDKGLPLPGVNVVVKNTASGTQTDFDGNYSLQANRGGVLSFSYVGFDTKDVVIGDGNSINVQLSASASELEEVIVTARGIKAKPRSLSYAIATVADDEIENTGEVNLVSSLTAKAPGVSVVSSSGAVGASANIRIRGNTSITRSNSPLFIVDGVPIDNSSVGNATGGTANSNRAIDINQNDIESISILKGIAAQTLYGLRAANGVVIITTKKGKSGAPTVSINSTVQVSEITQTPDLQKQYAQGRPVGGVATHRGPETREGFSWGPAISSLEFDGDSSYSFSRFGRLVPAGTGNGRAAEAYDNVDNFFVNGLLTDLNVSVRGGTETVRYYLSAGKLDQTGVAPTEDFGKKSFRADITADLSDKFEISASGSFVNSGGQRVQRGSNISGIMLGLLRTTPTFDNGNGLTGRDAASNPLAYELPDGTQRSYRAGVYDNPYWTVAKNPSFDDVNRFTGRLSFEYRPMDWLTLQGRYAYDRYSDIRKAGEDINSANNPGGRVFDDNIFNEDITTNFMALFNKDISETITFNAILGYENYNTDYLRRSVQGDGMTVPGFFDVSNTAAQITTNSVFRKKLDAVFADAKFGFNDMFFINGSVRNDWSSTLPKDNNDFLSYSAGLSFVFSELFESELVNYGKLRASYGRTGNDAPIYATQTFYNAGVAGGDGFIGNNNFPLFGSVGFERTGTAGSTSIEPEETTELEFGGEIKFFNSRIGLDITYYDKETTGQVFGVDTAPSAGFNGRNVNAGKIENNGIEIGANFVPVRTDDFSWNIDVNWTTYDSEVIELAPGVESFTLAGFTSVSSRVLPGESYGAIFGDKWLRNDAGQVLIDDNGFPIVDPTSGVIGDPIPDWQMGIKNTVTYKNLSLGFLFDIREGGDVWCGTCGIVNYFGVGQETADQRNVTDFVFDGVVQSTGQTNTQQVALADPAAGLGGNRWVRYGFGGVGEDSVYDASWVRLREASLTYNFGEKLLNGTPLSSGSVTVSGRNLWLSTDYPGVDPETNLTGASNGIGLDYFNQPNTRSYAVSLKLNF